uniref:SPOC domain-containing protein n=1 Tax=Acrobeloides nanus TaxID=290746 RepID=A0A914C9Q7_9BILA
MSMKPASGILNGITSSFPDENILDDEKKLFKEENFKPPKLQRRPHILIMERKRPADELVPNISDSLISHVISSFEKSLKKLESGIHVESRPSSSSNLSVHPKEESIQKKVEKIKEESVDKKRRLPPTSAKGEASKRKKLDTSTSMPENKSEDNNLLKKYGLSLVMVEIDRIPAHLLALARGKSGSTKIDTLKEKMKPVKTKEDLKPSLKQVLSGGKSKESKTKRKSNEIHSDSGSPPSSADERSRPSSPVALKEKKLPNLSVRRNCITCGKTIESIYNSAASETAYCSSRCITLKVEEVRKLVNPDEKIMCMSEKGTITAGKDCPTISELEHFIIHNPNYHPVVNTTKSDAKGSSSKLVADDTIRWNVKKRVAEEYSKRAKNSRFSITLLRSKQMAEEIEVDLYRIYKSTKDGYKRWVREFLLQLMSEKSTLFRDISTNEITIPVLVSMSSDEIKNYDKQKLANSTLAKNDLEKLNGVQSVATTTDSLVETSEKSQMDGASNIVSISDSIVAEEIKEEDRKERPDDTLKHFTIAPAVLTPRYTMIKKKTTAIVTPAKSAVDDILGDGIKDTTSQHMSHLYDVNCEICKQKTKFELLQKERLVQAEKERQERIEAKQKALQLKAENKSNVNSPTKSIRTSDGREVMPARLTRENPNVRKQTSNERLSYDGDDYGGSGGYSPDDGFGNDEVNIPAPIVFDEPPQSPLADAPDSPMDEEKQLNPEPEPVEEAPNPWKMYNHQVWSGLVRWGNKFEFDASFLAISNPLAFELVQELDPILKVIGRILIQELDPILKVIGRIEPSTVWKYIQNLKNKWSKQVVVLMLEPPQDFESNKVYFQCYDLMRKDNRYGVINFKEHPTVKDGYIFALEPEEPLPRALLPLDGPGLPETPDGVILAVVIRKLEKDIQKAKEKAKEIQESSVETTKSSEDTSLVSGLDELESIRTAIDSAHRESPTSHKQEASRESLNETLSVNKSLTSEDLSSNQEASKIHDADYIETLDDLLGIINSTERPADVVVIVGKFLNNHVVTQEEKVTISSAIKHKVESERSRHMQALTPASTCSPVPPPMLQQQHIRFMPTNSFPMHHVPPPGVVFAAPFAIEPTLDKITPATLPKPVPPPNKEENNGMKLISSNDDDSSNDSISALVSNVKSKETAPIAIRPVPPPLPVPTSIGMWMVPPPPPPPPPPPAEPSTSSNVSKQDNRPQLNDMMIPPPPPPDLKFVTHTSIQPSICLNESPIRIAAPGQLPFNSPQVVLPPPMGMLPPDYTRPPPFQGRFFKSPVPQQQPFNGQAPRMRTPFNDFPLRPPPFFEPNGMPPRFSPPIRNVRHGNTMFEMTRAFSPRGGMRRPRGRGGFR